MSDFDISRTSTAAQSTYCIDDAASEIQRGYIVKPTGFGDQTHSSSHQAFSAAANFASGFSTIINFLRNSVVDNRDPQDNQFKLTTAEYRELQKVALNISNYGNITYDVVEDFLLILCYIDNIEDLTIIANGVEIDQLADASLIHNPFAILAISDLYKIAYLASAVDGLVNLFRKYLPIAGNTSSHLTDDINQLLSSLSSVLSGFSGAAASARLQNNSAEDALGHFLSELITGNRIPTNVIAKNPNLQDPSYTGKAFFGESPTALTNVDIDQDFAKKIAVFPRPSNGAATTSFGLQNIGSMANLTSIPSLVSKIMFGNTNVTAGSKKSRQLDQYVSQVISMTGGSPTETIDIRRADTAIPLMISLSAVCSGTDKSIFSSDVFRQGWLLANSVSNSLQQTNSKYLEVIKRFT